MKKRLFILMTLLVLVVSLPLSVSADLIYQPRDDFFKEYWDDCRPIDTVRIANGPDGKVTIYKSPKDSQIQGTIPNGEEVYIAWVYTASNGIDWGCVYLWGENIEGWIPMPYAEPIQYVPTYGSADFWEEFKDRIEEENGDLYDLAGLEIRYWRYPGSENCKTIKLEPGDFAPAYQYTFVDISGQKWCMIRNYEGMESSWVCLDNPAADYDTLYANHAPQPVTKPEIPPQTYPVHTGKIITPGSISPTTILITVAAVAAISIALLVVLKNKKT